MSYYREVRVDPKTILVTALSVVIARTECWPFVSQLKRVYLFLVVFLQAVVLEIDAIVISDDGMLSRFDSFDA